MSAVSTATAGAAGGTVVVMASASVNSSVVSNPPMIQGAQAAVSYLNAHGGLHGHHIKLIVCDNKNTPNLEVACARQAVATKVVALVGANFETNATSVVSVLTPAGIPVVSPIDGNPAEFKAPTYFNLWSQVGTKVAIGLAMGQKKCKSGAGVALNVPIANLGVTFMKQGQETAGVKTTTTVEVPIQTTDFSPTVEQLSSLGVTCSFPLIVETQYVPYFQALQSAGSKVKNFIPAVGFNTGSLKTIGAQGASGTIFTSPYLTPSASSSTPQVRTFMQGMHKYQPSATPDSEAENSWVAVMILNQATKGLNKWTAASVLGALRKDAHVNVGFGIPTLNFTKKNPTPKVASIYDTAYHLHVVKGITQTDTNTIVTVESTLKKVTFTTKTS
ncbi:MAG TPA: ABC transporter substrate-binding protein [Acidimicrobiales bacterium]|nr:ABC transporter substrate-binding protein [Acidimicrobiales bacterium]